MKFGRYLGQKAQRQGHTFIDLNQDGIDDRLQDFNFLAQKMIQVHQEQPSLLSCPGYSASFTLPPVRGDHLDTLAL